MHIACFLLGHAAIAGGCYLLSVWFGWHVGAGVWLVVVGAFALALGFLHAADDQDATTNWHGGKIEPR